MGRPMERMLKPVAAGVALAGAVYAAACGWLYLSQRSYIYYPTARGDDVPALTLRRGEAEVLVSVHAARAERAVLYFGGNAEDASRALPLLRRAFPDAAVYAMHYRGYGGSGGTPSERALVGDALALFDHAAPMHPRITVVGRSLGSGIAVQVAAARAAERLVLVTPYDSLAEIAAGHFRLFPTRWLLRDRYDSASYAGALRLPTTIILAGQDRVVPPAHGQRLAKAFPPGVAEVIAFPGADHGSVSAAPAYLAALAGRPVAERGAGFEAALPHKKRRG